jgi:hypothetical protein
MWGNICPIMDTSVSLSQHLHYLKSYKQATFKSLGGIKMVFKVGVLHA